MIELKGGKRSVTNGPLLGLVDQAEIGSLLGVVDQAVMGESRPLLWMLVCAGPCGSPCTDMLEPGAPMLVCTNRDVSE